MTRSLPIRAALLGVMLGLGAAYQPAAAQVARPDSTIIRYEEVAVPEPTAAPAAASRLQVQERTLWKLGLNNLLYLPADWSRGVSAVPQAYRYARYGLHVAFERKLGAQWAVMGELSPYLLDYQPAELNIPGVVLCGRSQLAARYYYNLGRRLRLGKSAGNFSGNYLSVSLGGGYGQRAHETAFFFFRQAGPFTRFDVALLYGLQRRLGRYGFADFNVGIPFALSAGAATSVYYPNFSGPTLAVNLRLGLCLGQ